MRLSVRGADDLRSASLILHVKEWRKWTVPTFTRPGVL
jgi:hypothetical protein